MAKELGPKNIRVNALCPGMIATTFHDTFTKNEVRTNVANGTRLKRAYRTLLSSSRWRNYDYKSTLDYRAWLKLLL